MAKKKNNKYAQCLMIKPFFEEYVGKATELETGYQWFVSWIPNKFAKKGKTLTFDGRPGIWHVSEVWGTKSEKHLIEHERDYKNQRKASDI